MLISAFSKLQASTLALETTHSTVSTIPKRLQITQQVLGKRITNTFWTCTCTFIYLPSIELAPTRIPSLTPYRWRTCRWSWTSRTTRTTPWKSSASLMSTTSSTRRSRRLTCSSWGDCLFRNIFFDNQTRTLFSQAESRGWSCIWGARANFCLVGLWGDLPKDGDHQRWARAAQDEVGLLCKSQTCSPGHWWARAKNNSQKLFSSEWPMKIFPS